jgi:hypothetical protein
MNTQEVFPDEPTAVEYLVGSLGIGRAVAEYAASEAATAAPEDEYAGELDDYTVRRDPATGAFTVTRTTPPAPWCETCGNEVSPEGKCGCWAHLADALQRYLGMDFDASADSAARLWDAHADRERVWSAGYADDHDVETYPDTRGFAPADVREADARDYPHDEPCPRCGRRQWTDENAPETCTACGYEVPGE